MSVVLERNVMVPMRDGVRLATDVWIPDNHPAPALLVRLPYGKSVLPGMFAYTLTPNLFDIVAHGYAVVWQDCRGTFDSEGDFVPLAHEAEDGVDTIRWIREQAWCDGNIATYGASYFGMTQWLAAGEEPSGLSAIAPTVSSPDFYIAPWYTTGGALGWGGMFGWCLSMAIADAQRAVRNGAGSPQAVMQLAELAASAESHLLVPPADQELLGRVLPWWNDFVSHPERDSYWRSVSAADRLDEIRVPGLHVGGWFDNFVTQTVRSFSRLQRNANGPEHTNRQRLIVGPWDHLNHTGIYHDRQFGGAAHSGAAELTEAHITFFDRWVRGIPDALDGVAPVRIFVMGIDQWRDEQTWPLPDTAYTDYFLDGGGNANASSGDGRLSTSVPAHAAIDEYEYDPSHPVPTKGGRVGGSATLNAVGPVDQRVVEARRDVLCYTTEPLKEPLEVTGEISLVLHVSSSAPDTDFTAKLVDVHPDGRALYLTDGILRMRYRNALDRPELITPETVYEITIDVGVTSNVFLPGHRIRLEISSSNFPRYDRNTNTGGVIAEEDLRHRATSASNRVLHGPDHLSRLILPLIECRA